MPRRALVALAALAVGGAGCSAVGSPGRELAYADVQAVQPGLTAPQVLDAYGQPARVERGPDGRVRAIEYAASDARGSNARLYLDFDAREVLVRKRFTGAATRP
jgi:hypothetical protein